MYFDRCAPVHELLIIFSCASNDPSTRAWARLAPAAFRALHCPVARLEVAALRVPDTVFGLKLVICVPFGGAPENVHDRLDTSLEILFRAIAALVGTCRKSPFQFMLGLDMTKFQ